MAARDPWASLGVEVEPYQPPQQRMGSGAQPAPTAAPANDPYASMGEVTVEEGPAPIKIDFSGPLDPTGEGDIGFASKASNEANSLPEGAQEFQRQFAMAVNTPGFFQSPEEMQRYAKVRGFDFPLEQAQTAFDHVQQGGRGVEVATPTFRKPDISYLRGEGGLMEMADAGGRGALGLVGIDDEVLAIVESAVHGTDLNESLARQRAIRDYDEEENFWERSAGTVGAGVLIPSGVATEARAAAVQALRSGAGRQGAIQAARRAVAVRLGQEGAAVGAAHGAGAADGNLGDRALGAAVEAPIGAVSAAGLGAAGSKVLGLGAAGAAERNALTEGQEVAAAAGRQGVDVLPADVGGATTRRLTSAAAQAPLSAAPIVNAAQRSNEQAQAVRDRVASSIGQALRPEGAGQAAKQGARSYISRTSKEARKLYDQAASAAGDSRIAPTKALETLDRNIAELAETPGGVSGLTRLEALREVLGQGDFTVRGLRNMRTALNDDFAEAGLRSSDIKRRVDQVVDAAADDIVDGLNAQGKQDAARRFRVADRYWRNRVRTIDTGIAPIIGKDGEKSGEQVVKAIMSDMQGNNARAAQFLRTLPDEEKATVRASIIGNLGRSTKGQQNAEGDAFSLPTFLTNWNEIGETAKLAYFGKEGRAALNDLAKIAEGTKNAQKYANFSNSSGGIWGNLGVLAGGAALDLKSAGAATVAQLLGGRLLASPRFARWLAAAPKKPNPAAQRSHLAALNKIAQSEPAIAAEIIDFQHALQRSLASPATAAAAEEQKDVRGEQPKQEGQQ